MKVTFSGFICALAILGELSYSIASTAPDQPVKIRLETDNRGQLRVIIKGAVVATLPDPQGASQSFATNSLRLHRTKANEIALEAQSFPISVMMNAFPGCQAELPKMFSASYQIDPQLKQFKVQTKAAGQEAVVLTFPDGAQAQLSGKSQGRMAAFDDGTYSFYGDGAVKTITADGKTNVLSRKLPPMRGGPLSETVDTNGTPRIKRLAPPLKLVISGDIGGPIAIEGGGQRIVLEPNIDPPMDFANGSKLNFDNMSQSKQLKCQVTRGDVELAVAGIDGWKAVLQSGQTVGVEFDRSKGVVDLKNLEDGPPVLVLLPAKTIAEIEFNATFQFAHVDRNTFSTAAAGGKVQLYDTRTSQETSLTEENLLFVGGIPQVPGLRSTTVERVAIAWNPGSSLALNGEQAPVSGDPDNQKVMRIAEGKDVGVSYNQNGDLEIQAVRGNYSLQLSALRGVTMNMAMGDTVILHMDQNQNALSIRGADDNANPINIMTVDGFNPGIAASKGLNLTMAKDGTVKATSTDGGLFDFTVTGAANNNNPGSATSNPLGTGSSSSAQNIDVTRITEPTLSVKR